MLRQKPDDPLPILQLIFLYRNDDIRAWFHANKGHDPWDLMALKSCREDREDLDETVRHTGRLSLPLVDKDL